MFVFEIYVFYTNINIFYNCYYSGKYEYETNILYISRKIMDYILVG